MNKEFLEDIPLFSGINDESLQEIAAMMRKSEYKNGDTIIKDGTEGSDLFILAQGQVSVAKKMTLLDSYGEDTKNRDKALLQMSGEDKPFFGEMAVFSKELIRSATVTAGSDCVVYRLDIERFTEFAEKNCGAGMIFYKNLARIMAERLKSSNSDILKLTTALCLALDEN